MPISVLCQCHFQVQHLTQKCDQIKIKIVVVYCLDFNPTNNPVVIFSRISTSFFYPENEVSSSLNNFSPTLLLIPGSYGSNFKSIIFRRPPNSDINLGHHWLRWLLAAWRHLVITWANTGLSMVFCGIHLRIIAHVLMNLLTYNTSSLYGVYWTHWVN